MLVDQVRAVTTTAKEIEAKISTDVWDRQKHWEMKRDVLFEATKRLGELNDALVGLNSAFISDRNEREQGRPGWPEGKLEASKIWMDTAAKFAETELLVRVVCGKELSDQCLNLLFRTRSIAQAILKGDLDVYSASSKELVTLFQKLPVAIRKELETDQITDSLRANS
jgi:hypothetical protein